MAKLILYSLNNFIHVKTVDGRVQTFTIEKHDGFEWRGMAFGRGYVAIGSEITKGSRFFISPMMETYEQAYDYALGRAGCAIESLRLGSEKC